MAQRALQPEDISSTPTPEVMSGPPASNPEEAEPTAPERTSAPSPPTPSGTARGVAREPLPRPVPLSNSVRRHVPTKAAVIVAAGRSIEGRHPERANCGYADRHGASAS